MRELGELAKDAEWLQEEVTHEDMERVRLRLGIEVRSFCRVYLRVDPSTYARWADRGVPGTAQQFIRIMDLFPKIVMGTLAPDKED